MEKNQEITLEEVFRRAKDDFKVFVEHIIGLNNEPFHNELDDQITNQINKKMVISYPRGHGKSTHISVAYPLWLIAKDHNLRILLISATGQVSKSFMTEIMGHIEKNVYYQAFSVYCDPDRKGVVPKMKSYAKLRENWSGDSIIIDRENLNLKDPTIHAVGVFGSILSKRADVIICDDIVNQENSNTEEQRLKVIDWIYTTVLPVLIPGGTFVYIGNTWHQDDLVARLLDDPQFDYREKIPAILKEADRQDLWQQWATIILNESYTTKEKKEMADEFYTANKADMDKGAVVLWPTRYPYKDLYLMRLANPYSFARMYMCDPSNRPNQKFRDEWLDRAAQRGKELKLQDEPRDGFIMDMTCCGLDLAISLEASADDTCLLTLDRVKYDTGEFRAGDYIVRNIKRGKMTPNDTRNMVKKEWEVVRPLAIRVESVAYQEAMVKDLESFGIPVEGYHTGGEKYDPDIGVNSLAILAELGKLVFPYYNQDPRTIQLVSKLMNEMRAFPDGHTGDSLMAFWFAFSQMRDLSGDSITVPSIAAHLAFKDPPPMSTPEERKPLEDIADKAWIAEQDYERSQFQRMMRQNMRH